MKSPFKPTGNLEKMPRILPDKPGAKKPIITEQKKKPLKPPVKSKNKPYPMPRITDDRIIRTMPITEKQLGTIKKMYGIK
jgi:hypothetical protein